MTKLDELSRVLGRIEGSLTEIKNDIKLIRDDHKGLRSEFQTLEAGRLTRLESQFAVQQAEMGIKAKNVAMVWSAITAIFVSVISAIIIYFLKL